MTINGNNNNKMFSKNIFWEKKPTAIPASICEDTEKVIERILQ